MLLATASIQNENKQTEKQIENLKHKRVLLNEKRDKEYELTKGTDKTRVHYFTANLNGEAETLKLILSPNCTARIKELDFYFEEIEIKGRSSMGNKVTKYPIKTVKFKEAGKSTLAGRKLWFDDKFGRLNTEEKGKYLGSFEDEKLIVITKID